MSTNKKPLAVDVLFLVAALTLVTPLVGCADPRLFKTIEGHTIHDLAVSPDGKHLLIAESETSENNFPSPPDRWSVRLCETETGRELKRIGFAASKKVAYAPDGIVTLYGGWHEIACWDPLKQDEPVRIRPERSVNDFAWLPESRQLVLAGNGWMCLWDMATLKTEMQLRLGNIQDIAVSADGRRLVAYVGSKGRNRNSIQVWDLESRQVIQDLKGYNYNYRLASLLISADGKTAVVGMEDGHVTVWDTETGVKQHLFRSAGKVRDLAISFDGRKVLVARGRRSGGPFTNSGKNSLFLYDLEAGDSPDKIAILSDETPILHAALTPDGQFAFAVVEKEHIYRWKLKKY